MRRVGTKQELLVQLLERRTGASIAELAERTGWKPKSVHAALSTLRARGRDVVAVHSDAGKHFRITTRSS
jgi:predicted transcriptional regulator